MKIKRMMKTVIILVALFCLKAGLSAAEQAVPDDYAVFSSAQQRFSFLYNSNSRAEWNDVNGATVYPINGDAFSRIQIFRTIFGDTTGFAVEEYFECEAEEMVARLGASLQSVGMFQKYTVSGISIPGVLYQYTENGKGVALLSLLQDTGESLLKYSCFFYMDQTDLTLQALADAVRTYQPDAEYYAVIDAGIPEPEKSMPTLKLVRYDGGFFSVMIPEGWQIQTMGQYTTFGFRAVDPQNADYQIFYYGKMNPFLKSDAAKAWNRKYAGISYLNAFYADTIVVQPHDVSMLFSQWNKFANFVANYTGGIFYTPGFSFPSLKNFSVIDSIPIKTYFAAVASSEAIVTGSFQSEKGTRCFAKLCASLVPGNPSYVEDIDVSTIEAYGVSGVLAPNDAFWAVEQALTEAVYSLTFTQAYVEEANAYVRQTGEAAMAANAALRETYDRYNKAWHSYILEH